MIDVILNFTAPNGDVWTKRTVIHRPMGDEIIHADGLLFGVKRIEHHSRESTLTVVVQGTVTGNIDWELGHERGWRLNQ